MMNIFECNVLVNTLGISDSGGITVLNKVFKEFSQNRKRNYTFICNDNQNINNLIKNNKTIKNFNFIVLKNRGFIYRLFYENVIFNRIIKNNNIKLVYNFSGSAQFFLKVPQLVKIHNLVFYSKKLDEIYIHNGQLILWLKQIFFKRIVLKMMINQAKYFEIQSLHVKDYLSDYIKMVDKKFYVKSDIAGTDCLFKEPKQYDFSKKIRFLYIVGPHFKYIHKNFLDFTNLMIELDKSNTNFEINITLTKEQLNSSELWDSSLNYKTIFLGYISDKEKMDELFCDNTILISTSIIETLGLHVVEAIVNGIIAIVPNENYSNSVYGNDMFTYNLFDTISLTRVVNKISLLSKHKINDIISKNQEYLINNENKKHKNIVCIFDEILKDEYVQK